MRNERPVVVVTDRRWTRSRPATAWRRTIAAALQSLGQPVQALEADTLAEHVGPGTTPSVVLTESPEALDALAGQEGWRENLWLPVFPAAPHDWPEGKEWVELVRGCADRVTGFLTESEQSRDEIEAALADRRVEVVVLPVGLQAQHGSRLLERLNRPGEEQQDPQLAGLADLAALPRTFRDGRRWSFAGAKVLPSSQFAVEGTTWEFNDNSWPGTDLADPQPVDHETLLAALRQLLASAPTEDDPVRVAVLGPQLSFIDQLSQELTRRRRVRVEMDQWPYLSGPGGGNTRTPALLESSDVVVSEWARPNGKWIQEQAADHQRLIVRAHRYEVTTDFPSMFDMDRYAAAVVITPWVGRTLVQDFGWPAEKMVFIPNYVEGAHFRRPKLPGAEFTLGMVGIRPSLKRLDLALDLLQALREVDARYALRIRGDLPPGRPHWEREELRQQWGRSLQRIQDSPLLRNAVFFDGAGRDMSRWYRQIGVILSVSDLEGSHVALAEGVASGAVPVARPWQGITTLWPEDIVADSLNDAVSRVLAARDARYRAESQRRLGRLASLDGARVVSAWEALLRGDLAAAQAHFGPVDWQAPPMEPVPARLVSDRIPHEREGAQP